MTRGPVLALIAATLLLAGCGGPRPIAQARLPDLVLRTRDLPRGFSWFYRGPQVRLDNQGTVRSDQSRFGREGGWIVRLRRRGSSSTPGPLVVESRADVFTGTGGARSDLRAYGVELASIAAVRLRRLEVPKTGDAAIAVTYVQPALVPVRFFTIAWRYRNVTASLTLNGFEGKVSLAQTLALARRQQLHIAAS